MSSSQEVLGLLLQVMETKMLLTQREASPADPVELHSFISVEDLTSCLKYILKVNEKSTTKGLPV